MHQHTAISQTDSFSLTWDNVTVVIPTLNEASNITPLLKELHTAYPGIGVLIVDDRSSDGTQAAVRRYIARSNIQDCNVFLLERNGSSTRGLTASVLDGLSRVDTEYFAVMDGDLQHPPAALGAMLEAVFDGADLAVGTRLPYRENQGWHRILVTRCATALAQRHLLKRGIALRDPMSGLFAGRVQSVRPVIKLHVARFEHAGYKVLFDLLRIAPPGLRLAEIPYEFGLRNVGKSKLKPRHFLHFIRSLRR